MPHHLAPNVHQEHLPAGRYAAGGSGGTIVDPFSSGPAGGEGGVHRASKIYRSVASSVNEMEEYSGGVSAVFALLAVVQISLSAKVLFRYAPALGHAYGPIGGNWARGKAQWILMLVPASVARASALLLLLSDLAAKADGSSPAQISFLFQASSFFDAASAWLFYTMKLCTISTWAACWRGPGPHWGRFMIGTAALSLLMALSLAVTVTLSLQYGALCLQTHDVTSCKQRQSWYAAFHHVLVLISVFTTVGAMAMVATTLRGRWKMHPRPNQSGGGTMIHRDAAPGEEPASPGNAAKIGFGDAANPGVFGGRAFVPLVEEAGAIQSSALLCAFSFCWWTLFNVFSALHSDQLIQSTPEEVSLAVAANWLLSELIPSLAVSLALSRHVTRLCREAPVGQATRNSQSYSKIGGSGADTGDVPGAGGGVFRQGSELLPFR